MIMKTYKIRIVKLNKPSKYKYHVLSVSFDKKYQYFIIKTKIYQHTIIETISSTECDYIEIYDEESVIYGRFSGLTDDKPLKVIQHE